MRFVKVSVICCLSVLLLSGFSPAQATTLNEPFGPPAYAKYEDSEFKFALELDTSSDYLARAWYFDVKLKNGTLETSEIKAGEEVSITEKIKYHKKTGKIKSRSVDISVDPVLFENKFSRFDIWQDDDTQAQFKFLGEFEYDVLSGEDAELLYVYGNFVPVAKEEFSTFDAFISDTDPYKPINPSNPVPEPASLLLVGVGMVGVALVRKRPKH